MNEKMPVDMGEVIDLFLSRCLQHNVHNGWAVQSLSTFCIY